MLYIKRFVILLFCSLVVLELFFVLRIALMNAIPMRSTAFERTAAVELLFDGGVGHWQHEWRDYADISDRLKRAVIAAEDSRFMGHNGVEWQAIWKAWEHNQRSSSVRGGSTITQQLAKNLFLSTEQTYLRKAQELLITFALELLLSKEDVLELYLNHAEWGRGIYGAQAAVNRYFSSDGASASKLTAYQAATLAAMLPSPRSYENHRGTPFFQRRVRTIMAGIPAVEVP